MKRNIFAITAILSGFFSVAQVDSSRIAAGDTTSNPMDSLALQVESVIAVTDTIVTDVKITAATPSVKTESKYSGEVYKIKPIIDIPLTVATTAWTLYGFSKIYGRDTSTNAQILALRKEDINSFDRIGASVYSEKAKDASDLLFYGSMPLPLLLLADKEIRKDAGKIGILYLEAMGITGMLYTASAMIVDRYRPLAYNPNVPFETRKRGGAKNSFFAGHVALVGTSTFFTASVFDHYHPNSKLKYVFYSAAGVATLATGYLRYKGGQHFKTDIIVGTVVGTLSGLLIPRFHRVNRFLTDNNVSFSPVVGEHNGFTMRYTFK